MIHAISSLYIADIVMQRNGFGGISFGLSGGQRLTFTKHCQFFIHPTTYH